jgi:L-lactate dehydrogenase complex protein LldG
MRPSGRVAFIDKVKRALKRQSPVEGALDALIRREPEADDSRRLEKIAGRDRAARLALLDRLFETGRLLKVEVMAQKDAASAADAIARIAAAKNAEWGEGKSVVAWDHPLVNQLALETALRPLAIPVHFADGQPGTAERQAVFRQHAEGALIGVTAADYCMAQTATLGMKTRPGQPRCVSLLPSIHIVVIRLEQILADLKEFYTLLKWNPRQRAEGLTRCLTLITGPSKTADIEATLVHGAHGPRELVILVLTG